MRVNYPRVERAMDAILLTPTRGFDLAKGRGAAPKVVAILWLALTAIPCLMVAAPLIPIALVTYMWEEMR